MPSFSFNWGNIFKEKVKENAEIIEDTANIIKDPSKIIDYSINTVEEGFSSIINLFIVGFIYIIIIIIMLISVLNIFNKQQTINKIKNKTISSIKKSTKGGK